MRLTKYGHSCVLVEAQDGGNTRVALFDPGVWSRVPIDQLGQLDDVFISHVHADHCDAGQLRAMVAKFPHVRITATTEAVDLLRREGVAHADDTVPQGAQAFFSPHEEVRPFGTAMPEEIGIHFLDSYTHPGDSHSFHETRAVLAMPIMAPWGSTRRATELILDLKPRYVLPVHDWFLTDEARQWIYDGMTAALAPAGITFLRPEYGVPLEVSV